MNALQWIPTFAFLGLLGLGGDGRPSSASTVRDQEAADPPRAPECDLTHPCFHTEVCVMCADGEMGCASAECVDGRCHEIPPCSGTRRKTRE